MAVSSVRAGQAHGASAAQDPSLEDALSGAALIRRGMRGPGVQQVQQALNARGARLAVDGDFGPATEKALQQFQRKAGVNVDGVVGPDTASALCGAATTQTTDTLTKEPVARALPLRAPTPAQRAQANTGLRAADLAQANPAPERHVTSATPATRKAIVAPAASKKAANLDVGAAGLSQGLGYENSVTKLYQEATNPAAAAAALLRKHGDDQPQIVLNEVSKSFASSAGTDGARYRSWLTQVAQKLSDAGKQVIVCSPVSGDPHVKALFQNLAKIPGVRLGMETQVTGKDDATTIREKLTHTLDVMRGIGVEPARLVHVANLATTAAKKNFGSDGGTQAQFSANIRDEVAQAKALGFSDVLGYGFRESAATQDAWRSAH